MNNLHKRQIFDRKTLQTKQVLDFGRMHEYPEKECPGCGELFRSDSYACNDCEQAADIINEEGKERKSNER